MLIIAIIMSGLALLAATVCLILLIQEKKRNHKRNVALIDYIDNSINEVKQAIMFDLKEEISAHHNKLIEEMLTRYDALNERINKLEKGIVPDFEEAKQAARAVDDFNRGLSNILGFDPIESLQREREKNNFGGEII